MCATSAAKSLQTESKFSAKPKYNGYILVHRLKWGRLGQGPINHPKFLKPPQILGAAKVTSGNFHTKDPQITGAALESVVSQATWRLGLVQQGVIFYINILAPS